MRRHIRPTARTVTARRERHGHVIRGGGHCRLQPTTTTICLRLARRLRRADQPLCRKVVWERRAVLKQVERDRRLRNYLLMMGIRTAAFACAALCGIVGTPLLMSLGMAAVAVVLPYPAVVMANAVDRRAELRPKRPSPRRAPHNARRHLRRLP